MRTALPTPTTRPPATSAAAPRRSTLAEILAAVRSGASGAPEVARRTGLDPEMVEAGLATLASTGLVRPLTGSGCPPNACGGCALVSGCATLGAR